MTDSHEFLISFYLGKIEQTDDEKLRARYIRRRDELEKELFEARTLDMKKWQQTYRDMLTKDEYIVPKALTFTLTNADPRLFETITGMSIDIVKWPPKYPLLRELLEKNGYDKVSAESWNHRDLFLKGELDEAVADELVRLWNEGIINRWSYVGRETGRRNGWRINVTYGPDLIKAIVGE